MKTLWLPSNQIFHIAIETPRSSGWDRTHVKLGSCCFIGSENPRGEWYWCVGLGCTFALLYTLKYIINGPLTFVLEPL